MKKPEEDNFGNIDQYDDDDITDSDGQYSDDDRQLLEKVRQKRVEENFDSDDEVYGLNLDEDEKDYNMPDERAWGSQKSQFFATDYVDQDYSTTNEKDLQKAKLEEESAREIQKRLAEQLDEADFNLHQFSQMNDDDGDDEDDENVVVTKDLSKLSKREKLALFRKESPEFEPLVNDSRGKK